MESDHRKASDFNLVEIMPNTAQIEILYDLLRNRPKNISHQEVPSFFDHCKFVHDHPYRSWWLLYDSRDDTKVLGSVYVSYDNSLGLHLNFNEIDFSASYFIDKLKIVLKPLEPRKSKIYMDYYYNVAPNNFEFISWLIDSGYNESQRSFVKADTITLSQ